MLVLKILDYNVTINNIAIKILIGKSFKISIYILVYEMFIEPIKTILYKWRYVHLLNFILYTKRYGNDKMCKTLHQDDAQLLLLYCAYGRCTYYYNKNITSNDSCYSYKKNIHMFFVYKYFI